MDKCTEMGLNGNRRTHPEILSINKAFENIHRGLADLVRILLTPRSQHPDLRPHPVDRIAQDQNKFWRSRKVRKRFQLPGP